MQATQTQETFENTSKSVKEAWNTPEFEVVGIEKTEMQASTGNDGFGSFTLS